MPKPGGGACPCPKASPVQTSVATRVVCHFAENIAPTPLRDFEPKTPSAVSYPFLSVPPNLRISRTLRSRQEMPIDEEIGTRMNRPGQPGKLEKKRRLAAMRQRSAAICIRHRSAIASRLKT